MALSANITMTDSQRFSWNLNLFKKISALNSVWFWYNFSSNLLNSKECEVIFAENPQMKINKNMDISFILDQIKLLRVPLSSLQWGLHEITLTVPFRQNIPFEFMKLFRDQRIHVPSDILRWFVGTFLSILCTHFDRQIKNSGFIQIRMFNYKIT